MKILNQSQKNFSVKKAYFLGHPISGTCVQNAWTDWFYLLQLKGKIAAYRYFYLFTTLKGGKKIRKFPIKIFGSFSQEILKRDIFLYLNSFDDGNLNP